MQDFVLYLCETGALLFRSLLLNGIGIFIHEKALEDQSWQELSGP